MFQYPHGNFPSSEGLFSRGKLRLAYFLLQCEEKISDEEPKIFLSPPAPALDSFIRYLENYPFLDAGILHCFLSV
jgi:hypothetical protein